MADRKVSSNIEREQLSELRDAISNRFHILESIAGLMMVADEKQTFISGTLHGVGRIIEDCIEDQGRLLDEYSKQRKASAEAENQAEAKE